jgi:hypothetical protein
MERSKNGEAKERPLKGLFYSMDDYPLQVYNVFISELFDEACIILEMDKKFMLDNNLLIFDNDGIVLFKFVRLRLHADGELLMDFVEGTVKQFYFRFVSKVLNNAPRLNNLVFKYRYLMDKIKGKFNGALVADYIKMIELELKKLSPYGSDNTSRKYIINCEKYIKNNILCKHHNYTYAIQFYYDKRFIRFNLCCLKGADIDEDKSRFGEVDIICTGLIEDNNDIHTLLINLFYNGDIDEKFQLQWEE